MTRPALSTLLQSVRTRTRDALAKRLHVPRVDASLERLRNNGLSPRLVYDVGAYRGDFAREVRGIWPSTKVVCFEPLPERVRDIEALMATDRNVSVVSTLLGARRDDAVVFHENETASSVLADSAPTASVPTTTRAMRTLDDVAAERGEAPDFLKLDVQGYELEVLKGAEKTLKSVQAILAEVNLIDVYKGAPLMAELLAWLQARGFVAYDIASLIRRPLDGALWQADMVFVPESSALRSDKRW